MNHIEYDVPRQNGNMALPTAYDDSLSYGEEVRRVKMNLLAIVTALNALIDLQAFDNTAINNLLAENVVTLNNTITSLNNAMDNKKEDITDLTNVRKLDATGNFTGSWWGIEKPIHVEGGIDSIVEQHITDIANINTTLTSNGEQISFLDKLKLKFVFGAKGDGVTDDTQAIMNYRTYCHDNKLPMYFFKGTFLLSEKIDITKGMVVCGEGEYSIINYSGVDTCINVKLEGADWSTWTTNFKICDITINGNVAVL